MAMATSLAASDLGSLSLSLQFRSRASTRFPKISYGFLAKASAAAGLPWLRISAKMSNDTQTGVPKLPKPTPPKWLVSLVLSVLSFVVPGWKTQFQMLLKLEDEVEKAVKDTAEAVETIAEAAEKVVEEVEHDLPEDSKLREGILMIEKATEEAKKDAKMALDLIDKVDEIKEEVEEVIEPTINPGEYAKKEA